MFVRVKHNGNYDYLQLVDSQRIDGQVRQRVIGTLGRRDLLADSNALAGLMASLGKFTPAPVSGTMNMAGNLGSLVTSLAFPYLLKWTGSTTPFFYVAAGLTVLAIVLWTQMKSDRPLELETAH